MKIRTIIIIFMTLVFVACKQPAIKTVPVKDTAKAPPKIKKVAADSNKVGPPPWCS